MIAAAELLPHFEVQAKERQKLSKGRGQKGSDSSHDLKGRSDDAAGKALGVSGRSVSRAKKVLELTPRPRVAILLG